MKLLTFLLIVIFFPLISFAQTETCLQNLNHPNYQSISQDIGNETIVREYIIHVPQNYDETQETALIFNLHGFGDCASDWADVAGGFYGFDALADEENFIAVYPQAAYRPKKEDTYWEPGDPDYENIFDNDVFFFDQLIEVISEDYTVDQNRIYACGYSNGGMMSYSLACNRANIYAAIGIMSGTMLGEDCTLENPVPVIKFHGIDDYVLPYNGNQWYDSVAEVFNYWFSLNDISESSLASVDLNNGNVRKDEYFAEGAENACMTLYTVFEEYGDPGGHVWFSEDFGGQNPNSIMWQFFNEASCLEQTMTSIENADQISVLVSPNPFTESIQININGLNSCPFKIYNLNGVIVQEGLITQDQIKIDLGFLKANLYLLQVNDQLIKLYKAEF